MEVRAVAHWAQQYAADIWPEKHPELRRERCTAYQEGMDKDTHQSAGQVQAANKGT